MHIWHTVDSRRGRQEGGRLLEAAPTPLIVRLINFKFRFRVLSGLKESLGTGGSILRIVNLLLVLYTTFIFNGSFKAPE